MANTTPVAFNPKPRKIGTVDTYTATTKVLMGQLVSINATGVSRAVDPSTTSNSACVGVAAHTAEAGAAVAVYGEGCEVLVMLSTDNGTADAGDTLSVSTIAGCAIPFDPAIVAHDVQVGFWPIGTLQEDIAAGAATVGGTGYVKLSFSPIWAASA